MPEGRDEPTGRDFVLDIGVLPHCHAHTGNSALIDDAEILKEIIVAGQETAMSGIGKPVGPVAASSVEVQQGLVCQVGGAAKRTRAIGSK